MLALGIAGTLLSIALITVSLLMVGLVLLQKNRGSGLSGAFGGVGGHSAFGTKTGDFLTWVTVGLVALFLLLNIVGNYVFEPTAPTKLVLPDAPSATPLDTTAGANGDSNDGDKPPQPAPASSGTTPGKLPKTQGNTTPLPTGQ